MPKIVSIVVTYNGERWVKKCFSSLISSNLKNHCVLAIDNGSTDDTLEIIQNDFPSVGIIETGENLGFGKANNVGIKKALELGGDYCFLLNQDAWVEPNTIKGLIKIHQQNQGYGILSPIHLFNENLVDNYYYKYVSNNKELINDLLTRKFRKKIYEVEFVNAAIWLISKECIEVVGVFAPVFYHYGEDSNYVKRARFHHFKTGIAPDYRGYHARNQEITHSTKLPNNKYKIIFKSKLLECMIDINHSIFRKTFEYFKLISKALYVSFLTINISRIIFIILTFLKFYKISKYLKERSQMKKKSAFLVINNNSQS